MRIKATLLFCSAVSAAQQWPLLADPQPPVAATGVDARLGAVASESKICSRLGASILQKGGNAADAMVSTLLCVGTIGMYHSGIGGGALMLVRSSSGNYSFIDARETAPGFAHRKMFSGRPDDYSSMFGGLSVGVPGELRGLEYLHSTYGSLDWRELVMPVVKIARDGFPVSADTARFMQFTEDKGAFFLTEDPMWSQDFAPNGTKLEVGEVLTRKRYADTLEVIANHGVNVFYNGEIAEQIVAATNSSGGILTLDDLRNYKVEVRAPVDVTYRGFKVTSCGAPASGAPLLSILKTIEGYDDIGEDKLLNLSTHRIDEATRFAYADRTNLGDPNFVPHSDILEMRMMSEAIGKARRVRISDKHTLNVSEYNPDGYEIKETHGTSHISIADASGMAISITSTINLIFGSQIMTAGGVILNDQMDDFSIPGKKNAFGYKPSPSNYIRPGKRPMSSMVPTIVEHLSNGTLFYVIGGAGGSRIITAVLQNLWHVLDRGMSAGGALYEPRFHDQLIPNVVKFEMALNRTNNGTDSMFQAPVLQNGEVHANAESGIGTGEIPGFDPSIVEFMKGRQHDIVWEVGGATACQAIKLQPNGTFDAAGEPRQFDSAGVAV